jgi:hypothetical protein
VLSQVSGDPSYDVGYWPRIEDAVTVLHGNYSKCNGSSRFSPKLYSITLRVHSEIDSERARFNPVATLGVWILTLIDLFGLKIKCEGPLSMI